MLSTEILHSFDIKRGFGEYKDTANSLLKDTIEILNEYKLDYFLISGTLLGLVRHKDFIPWDDDIDLIVDRSIVDKLPNIVEKYGDSINFIERDGYIVKTCYKNKEIELDCEWSNYVINKNGKYNWPFIDLFFFTKNDADTITFFNKLWDATKFFPKQNIIFNDIIVSIPKDPYYFLSLNYGTSYMTEYVSSEFDHKNETRNKKNYAIDKKVYDLLSFMKKL